MLGNVDKNLCHDFRIRSVCRTLAEYYFFRLIMITFIKFKTKNKEQYICTCVITCSICFKMSSNLIERCASLAKFGVQKNAKCLGSAKLMHLYTSRIAACVKYFIQIWKFSFYIKRQTIASRWQGNLKRSGCQSAYPQYTYLHMRVSTWHAWLISAQTRVWYLWRQGTISCQSSPCVMRIISHHETC